MLDECMKWEDPARWGTKFSIPRTQRRTRSNPAMIRFHRGSNHPSIRPASGHASLSTLYPTIPKTKFYGPPKTLGIAWFRACQDQVEPDPAEMAARCGADTSVLDWRDRLVCSRCGGRQVDFLVTETERR
jgi:ribosomal protein S27AE